MLYKKHSFVMLCVSFIMFSCQLNAQELTEKKLPLKSAPVKPKSFKSEAVKSTARQQHKPASIKGLSCNELSTAIKYSSCAGGVGALLKGADLLLGVNLPGNTVKIKNRDGHTSAVLSNNDMPTPVISLQLRPSFFTRKRETVGALGWGVAASYTNGLVTRQEINRLGQQHEKNLGSYISSRIIAVSPHLFYQLGAPAGKKYFRLGAGLAMGYLASNGFYYETDDPNQTECYQAATELVFKQIGQNEFNNRCQKRRVSESLFGLGVYTFLVGRYNNWSLEFSGASSEISIEGGRSLNPSFVSIIGSYHIPF